MYKHRRGKMSSFLSQVLHEQLEVIPTRILSILFFGAGVKVMTDIRRISPKILCQKIVNLQNIQL